MGSLTEKKRQVLEASQRRRGSRQVDDGSFHWRLYRYWATSRGYQPMQENLCHYVRVVMFWSWLWWLRNLLFRRSVGIGIAVLLGIGTTIAAGLTVKYWGWLVPITAGIIGVLIYVAAGLAMGVYHATINDEMESIKYFGWLRNRSKVVIALLTIPVLPVIVAAALIIAVLYLISLIEDIPFGDFFRWYCWQSLSSRTRWLTPLSVTFAVSITASGILTWWYPMALTVLVWHLVALGIVLGVVALTYTATFVEKRSPQEALRLPGTRRGQRRRGVQGVA